MHEDHALSSEIARVYSCLADLDPTDDEYQKTMNQLSKLYALQNQTAQLTLQAQNQFATHQLDCDKNAWKEEQDELPFYKRVDPNTLLTVAANIAVALAVIKYEQTGVISTKVLSFMRKI